MSTQLITEKVWQTITGAAKKTRYKSFVAVAYFGQGGARMLPLSKGSLLLVDASEKAVKSGQTCPAELLKLYNKGVHIFSLENLYSKLFILGNNLFIGSANVSSRSESILEEALMKTTDKKSVEDAKKYIRSFCKIELGDEHLKKLQKIYNPPKIRNYKILKINKKRVTNNLPSLFTYSLETGTCNDDKELMQLETERKIATKKRINKSRHIVDEFKLENINIAPKQNDIILQIFYDKKFTYVSPPGRLIHIRKWSNGNKITFFCFVEVPDKRRKGFKAFTKKLKPSERKEINRNGKRSKAFTEKIYNLWSDTK